MADSPASLKAFFSATPVIRLNGQEDRQISELLTGIKMEESEGGMSALEVNLTNWASFENAEAKIAFLPNSPKIKLGTPIELYTREEASFRELFRGKISALENEFSLSEAPKLTVLAEDALITGRMARRTKTYTDMSPADVARQIASNHSLQPVIRGLSSPTDVWVQFNESDLAFLRRLVGRFDGDVQVVGNELHVSPRGEVQRGVLKLTYGNQLRWIRWTVDLAGQVTEMSVRGWDALNGSAVESKVGNGVHLGPGTGRPGASVLREAFGERLEHLGHMAVGSTAEAQALAEAAFDLRGRRFLKARGIAEGNAELRVGTHVTLEGMGAGLDNTFYIVSTCHVYDLQKGYRTEFSAECAYLGN